jgi:prenyltransferase beta subunit
MQGTLTGTDNLFIARMTLAFFCLGSLSLLGQIDTVVAGKDRKDWIEWIYAQQVLPDPDDPSLNASQCGFKGSSWAGHPFDPEAVGRHLCSLFLKLYFTVLP